MKTFKVCLISLLLSWCMMADVVYAQGMFSPYLIGTFDQRNTQTFIQVINPTAKDIEIYVAFFDDNEKPLKCVKEKLSHNDLVEINVGRLKLDAKFGVVKIVSLIDKKIYPGIVGFQRHFFSKPTIRIPYGVTESNLASVPGTVLDEEFKIIQEVCR